MLIAYDKQGDPINDFQSNATEEGLLKNAEKRGINPKFVTIREVDLEEFTRIEEAVNGKKRADQKIEEEERYQRGLVLLGKLGLAESDIEDLKALLK